MVEEQAALDKTHTWNVITLPPGKSVIGCKRIHRLKTKADASVTNIRLVLLPKGIIKSM